MSFNNYEAFPLNLSIQEEVQTPQSLARQACWSYGFYLAFYHETYEIPYL
jgi:hypothetical protein